MAALTFVLTLSLATVVAVTARDPNILTDFVVPPEANASAIEGDFFAYWELSYNFSAPNGTYASQQITLNEFPALNGLGVSGSLLEFHPQTYSPPHIDARGSELVFMFSGDTLDYGIVDSSNKLYHGHIHAGMFAVFPQGLTHFMFNPYNESVKAVSFYGTANPGTISLPENIFGSHIDDEVLLKAFNITPKELKVLQAPYAHHDA